MGTLINCRLSCNFSEPLIFYAELVYNKKINRQLLLWHGQICTLSACAERNQWINWNTCGKRGKKKIIWKELNGRKDFYSQMEPCILTYSNSVVAWERKIFSHQPLGNLPGPTSTRGSCWRWRPGLHKTLHLGISIPVYGVESHAEKACREIASRQ